MLYALFLCRQHEAEHTGSTIALGCPASLCSEPLQPASVHWQPKLPRTGRWVSDATRPVTHPEGLSVAPGHQPGCLARFKQQEPSY